MRNIGGRPPIEPLKRFMNMVELIPFHDCWEWIGFIEKNTGYGTFRWAEKKMKAHRASYRLFLGDIPSGDLVCHKCDNRSCVNPGHLFLGSHFDNIHDCMNKGRFRSPVPILSTKQRQEIREWYAGGDVTQMELGEIYGVSDSLISNVVREVACSVEAIVGKDWSSMEEIK